MLHAIAIDDEPKALEVLKLHCEKVSFITLDASFREPVRGLEWTMSHETHVVFLDINMPGLSGLELGKMLEPGVAIIFTTAYSEYAVESYALKALDYLVKPIQFERFMQAVTRAREYWLLKQPGHSIEVTESAGPVSSSVLFIKSGTRHHRIDPDQILFIEKDGNYAVFHLEGKKVMSRHTMSQLLELLPAKSFMRVHKSYIVSIRHIDIVDPGQLTIGGQIIPVARNYRDVVQQLIRGE